MVPVDDNAPKLKSAVPPVVEACAGAAPGEIGVELGDGVLRLRAIGAPAADAAAAVDPSFSSRTGRRNGNVGATPPAKVLCSEKGLNNLLPDLSLVLKKGLK